MWVDLHVLCGSKRLMEKEIRHGPRGASHEKFHAAPSKKQARFLEGPLRLGTQGKSDLLRSPFASKKVLRGTSRGLPPFAPLLGKAAYMCPRLRAQIDPLRFGLVVSMVSQRTLPSQNYHGESTFATATVKYDGHRKTPRRGLRNACFSKCEFYGQGFSWRKNAFFQAPIKLAQPFPAPELRPKFLGTRGFF